MKLSDKLPEKNELSLPKLPFFALSIIPAALLVFGVLLMTTWIQVEAEEPEATQASKVSDSPAEKIASKDKQDKQGKQEQEIKEVPVSPYAKANRQHAQQPTEAHPRALAITVGHPAVPGSHGKQH